MTPRHLRIALVAITVAAWAAVARVAVAFLHNELDWTIVASYSRIDAPWYYRLAAVWGGLEGSLLLFTAILGAVATIACRTLQSRRAIAYAIGVVGSFAALDLALANPFRRLDIPATYGFGLTPILEHPAMAVHPPILYAGLAATLVAFLHAVDGGETSRLAAASRAWLRAALALVTVAMALGAVWSYVEQGWGGYWAWDPVENTSLLVWLGTLIALHTQASWDRQGGALARGAPWMLTLLGACIVRSGTTPSIHGFGQRAALGWWLLAITAATATIAVRAARGRGEAGRSAGGAAPTAMSVRIAVVVGVVVLAGTLAPIAVDLVTSRPAAVRGSFYAAFVGPSAIVAIPFLVARLRFARARGLLAHVGMLVLLAGIGATTFDQTATTIVAKGQTVRVAGVDVTNLGVRVAPGPRIESDAVVVSLLVDGHRLEPRRVAYRDRGGQLAENAVVTRPWRDLQVQLDTATDAEVVTITVYNRPLVWLVWVGAATVSAGALASPLPRRRRVVRDGDRTEPDAVDDAADADSDADAPQLSLES